MQMYRDRYRSPIAPHARKARARYIAPSAGPDQPRCTSPPPLQTAHQDVLHTRNFRYIEATTRTVFVRLLRNTGPHVRIGPKALEMRILVTGGAGFVGSNLCKRLVSDGHDVIALDNLCTGNRANVVPAAEAGPGSFELVVADVCKGIPVDGRFDRLYHLASPASPIDYVRLPFETMDVNSIGTRMVLERAHQDGARMLFASTSEVYGDPLVHPQSEAYWGNVNPIGPRSVYDESKRFGEALLAAYHRTYGVETRLVRIFNTYGPHMRPDDGRVIPTFVRQALDKEPLSVFGDGSQTRSFCFVDDLVEGLIRMMESNQRGPVNLGNPNEMTMLELANYVNASLESDAGVLHNPLPKDDPTRRKPDISLAMSTLDWSPKVPFDLGFARTAAWFRSVLIP